jgi:hypothetical protein
VAAEHKHGRRQQSFSLEGTIGQSVASDLTQNLPYMLSSGFCTHHARCHARRYAKPVTITNTITQRESVAVTHSVAFAKSVAITKSVTVRIAFFGAVQRSDLHRE